MADKALDDIIKQKRAQRFNLAKQTQAKKANPKQGVRKQVNKNNNFGNKKGRLFQEVQKDLGIKGGVKTKKPMSVNTDARNKIIQKQRSKFPDARDRLAQIAKQGDARDRLNKIRKTKPGAKVLGPQAQMKKTIVKKKIVNLPRQTFKAGMGGQTRVQGNAVLRTVPGADRRRNQQMFVQKRPMNKAAIITKARPAGRAHANNPGVFTVRNSVQPYEDTYEIVDYNGGLQLGRRGQSYGGGQSFGGGMGVPPPMETMYVRDQGHGEVIMDDYEPEVRPSRLRITAANSDYRVASHQQHQQYAENQHYAEEWEPQQQSWTPPARMQPRKREYYQEEVQVYPKKIVAAAPVSEPGTKVVVSNLHNCVSVEDMEELFGTVGTVLSVRMVRPGAAEAIFQSQEDAYRSVDLFNNRQLDGQPMKVMVVRKKVVTAAPVQARSVLRNARGRSGYY